MKRKISESKSRVKREVGGAGKDAGSLKKKVDVDEFTALERRVSLLEKRP